MVLISWFKEMKMRDLSGTAGSMPGYFNRLKECLLDLLACADPSFPTKDSPLPYAELSRTYSKMRNEASQLYRAADSSGMFENILSSMKFDLEQLSIDDAINLASKITIPTTDATSGDEPNGRHIGDDIDSVKQRLLTTSGYLKCVQVLDWDIYLSLSSCDVCFINF